MRVNSIRLEGIEHTKRSVVEPLVRPILESQNLGDVLSESREACHRISRLGVFRTVGVTLDTADPGLYGLVDDEAVDVVLNVTEAPRFYARTGADFSNYDTTTNITTRISNVLGGGEVLEANASYAVQPGIALNEPSTSFNNNETGSYFQLLLSKPILPKPVFQRPNHVDPDARAEFAAYSTNRNMSLHQSHEEETKGLSARYKTADIFRGTHELAYDVAWRRVHSLAQSASWSVRQDAGHTLKSAISHTYAKDHRDDPMLPTTGSYIRTREELAGLGGDVKFMKGEAEGQWVRSLGNGFIFTTSARGGLVVPFTGHRMRINDRFTLGGPNTVRGFRQSGIGPMDKKDAIGGDAYWAAGLSLFTPLPYLRDKPIKGHVFLNGGSLAQVNTATPPAETARIVFATPSVSAGLGLAVRFSILRLELNYCLPVTATRSDVLKPGFQFGIGVAYL
ncbi:surface antigen-domain-containing protein [Fimicolochytrium jonesii]|uniref:surface antigen-domain-containing protein n=1 Tax=Fimicolochytrium jonesii TaxID=1396493 RepID=UPI0022FEF9D6|nr:surface antigen-domain-containing protein [Fimicolochytrium jonesii]KAI8825718.1 surface antigen-domain-containing protein [Fimicolochytrium jonesii]